MQKLDPSLCVNMNCHHLQPYEDDVCSSISDRHNVTHWAFERGNSCTQVTSNIPPLESVATNHFEVNAEERGFFLKHRTTRLTIFKRLSEIQTPTNDNPPLKKKHRFSK